MPFYEESSEIIGHLKVNECIGVRFSWESLSFGKDRIVSTVTNTFSGRWNVLRRGREMECFGDTALELAEGLLRFLG